jgi:hypothetical protein
MVVQDARRSEDTTSAAGDLCRASLDVRASAVTFRCKPPTTSVRAALTA